MYKHYTCGLFKRLYYEAMLHESEAVKLIEYDVATLPYLGYKDESQDDSGTDKKPSAEKSSEPIDKVLQGIGSNHNNCKHNTGYVDGCCNILGIIKALDLHLAS